MSNEKRNYVKRKRAEGEAQTRERIAQAAVDLHGSVGPAFTSISAVAERAGVRRATVYRHFPDEAALFTACSGLWLSQNPLPDIASLAAIEDGPRRLAVALDALYGYYRANHRMLANVLRDAETSPALRETLTGLAAWLDGLQTVLSEGLGGPGTGDPPLRAAALGLATSFTTWRTLCADQGLADTTARNLMCQLVRVAEE